MESWVLDGDSYSFLRSAPSTFNLQHLDGPNHVEIFDITNIPSHRGAISETNCLCDIFGDDCESPSLSSSPASTSFLKKDVVERLPVEDVNDSSDSYHTANGSEHLSDGSDTYEDSKGLLLSENEESNRPANDPSLLNDKREVTSANGSLTQTGYQQECCSQDTSLKLQVKNSSNQQLVTSTSEFRDTNIRVTSSTQEIISPHRLSENKAIADQSHATSSELRDSDSAETIIYPDFKCTTKQKVVSSSEQKKSNSTQKIIIPDTLPENSGITEQRHTTTSEVREADSEQENKDYNQSESSFTEHTDSTEFSNNLAGEGSPKENGDLGCSVVEEEKIFLPYILPTGRITVVCETVESDSSVDLINCLNNGSDLTPSQKTASDPSTKDETLDLREMSAQLEHQDVPSKLADTGTFLCDDNGNLSDSEARNTVPPPTDIKDNTKIDVASMPQHCTISSEAREIVHENTSSLFSATTEEPSYVRSELCSTSGSLGGDRNSSEPPVIKHSPVGFTICPSPEPKNKVWSSGPEDLKLTPESPENDYTLTPTDKDSVSSFDSKLCPTPEPRSITSTPEVPGQNIFINDLSPKSSSSKLRSASDSPEIHIVTCNSLSRYSKSPQRESPESDFLSQSKFLAESFMSATLSTKEDEDKSIYSLSSAQESISCPSTTLPRDSVFPDPNKTRCTESPKSNTPTNKNSNTAIHSNVLLQDTCIIGPHSTEGIPRGTESPVVHEIRSEENSISTIPPANETKNIVISPDTSHLSNEGCLASSPSNLCPKDASSSDVVGAKLTEMSVTAIPTTKDIENVVRSPILQLLTTEGGISRPPSTLSAPRDTASPDVNEIRGEKIPASTTVLTNESFMAISPISNHSLTASSDTVFPEVEETRYAPSSITNMLPIKEIENGVITPISHLSSTDGGISRSPTRDNMSPDVLGTRCVEFPISTLNLTYETTNMVNSPISNICLAEEALSSPSSALNLPRNTSSPDVDGIKCEGIPSSTTILTNEMTYISNSPNDLLLMEGISRPTSHLDTPRESMFLIVDEIPPNMVISPNISSKEEGISRPPSTSSLSISTTSTGVDGLQFVENPISTILSKNVAPNMSISPVFDISSTKESISRSTSYSGTPRDSVTPDGGGIGCLKNSVSTIPPTDRVISPVCNLSTIEEGISNLSIPRDTMSHYVEERCAKRSNEIPTNENNDQHSCIFNLTTLSNMQTDSLISMSSPKMRYNRSLNRLNDHTPAPETCIPLGSTNNHLSTTVSEKVDLPFIIPVDAGHSDDTGYQLSLTRGILPQDDCTDITSVPSCQTNKKKESPEPPAPKLSVKQIKKNWERMNETILNSLNPWETSKKISSTPNAKERKEGNDNAKEMLEEESAEREKTFGQIAMRPGESPSVLHSNCPSVVEGQSCRNKCGSGERVIQEEHTLEKGVGNIAEASYRRKQVELSFSTRNRKGPANHSPAPSIRDPKSGIPPRYFESPLATRRQQSLLRAQNIQKEDKTNARSVRSTSQSRYSGVGCLSSECTSETSSMGSEFDEADSEVKWFTDQAFNSLSSPQMDYLDVYNSSHGSSTNISQHSTVDSPGSATWITYADLHESLHEKDDVLCGPSSFLPHCTLDPAKPFEMSSFECVDVAMENKEETKRGKRTVPKRQIQFKKRDFDESMCTENEGKEIDSLSTQVCLKDTFVRQHSTPASMQDDLVQGEHDTQTSKKMLQKSVSLDERSTKSKKASSVIKSVISKKMDTATKQCITSEPCENKKKHIESIYTVESSETKIQSSNLPPECSLSSEDFVGKEQRSPYPKKKSCGPKVPPKPVFKGNLFPPNSNSAAVEFQGKSIAREKKKPIMMNAFESKISKQQISDNSEKEANKLDEKTRSDSGRSINQTPQCTAIYVASKQKGMTNRDSKHPMIPETRKQQEDSSSTYLSKTPEITLKPSSVKDKNKFTLKDSFCPELKISKDTMCEPRLELEETSEEGTGFKPGVGADDEEYNEKNKEKSVLHKVRDVRKLVKNTYNLSFKATNTTHHVEDVVPEKPRDMQPENPHHLQIECKAISWKDKQVSCNKSTNQQDVTNTANESNKPQTDTEMKKDAEITKAPAETFVTNVQHSDVDLFVDLDKCDSTSKSGNCEQITKLEMPSRPPSKEISTLVFLQEDKAKSMQNPTSPTSLSLKTANSSHSVSMLRKEKGMQADIGVCDVLSEGPGAKPKHINRLEIPLQTHTSEEASSEFQKMKQEDADLPLEQKTSLKCTEGTLQVRSSLKPKEVRVHPSEKAGDNQSQRDLLKPPKEQETAIAASSKAEVRAFSSSTKIQAMPVTTSKEIELPIQVRSISSERPKPSVLPKLSYKQPFAEIRSTSRDISKTDITQTTSILKEQTPLKSEFKISGTSTAETNSEQATNAASSSTKTLAVSAVSSHNPQTIPVTTMASSAHQSTATTGRQEVSITSVQNSSHRQQRNIQEHVMSSASYASNYQSLPEVSQANTCIQPTTTTTMSSNQLHTENFHFATLDDPPSYDDRESFSSLQLSDLPPRRQDRYHPTTKHSLCSCTSCVQPQFGQPFHGSQNQTPPAPCSPGQVISYPGAPPQAQVRPHQSRPDGQPSNYPPVSLKTTLQQAPAMIHPIHHSQTCPAPAIQPYSNEQQQPSTQHMDRCSGNQRSPQAPSGATYREHSRSPNIAALDPRSQFFNPQELSPAFGHEYGSDGPGGGGVLYPENASGLGYSQGPRRVLLDTETGKYFYVEMPMQPLRKMLFDPELGQYVEVLMPQQGMSNSNMYPPTAVPYQGPYHGQGLYASQFLPYAVPPHPQSAQQPRHPEPSVPTSLHQNTMGYGGSASQVPKSDVKGHPSLDQSYLEGMYYIPTRMNASPNSTPSDCYHKPPTNMAAAGGRRA